MAIDDRTGIEIRQAKGDIEVETSVATQLTKLGLSGVLAAALGWVTLCFTNHGVAAHAEFRPIRKAFSTRSGSIE